MKSYVLYCSPNPLGVSPRQLRELKELIRADMPIVIVSTWRRGGARKCLPLAGEGCGAGRWWGVASVVGLRVGTRRFGWCVLPGGSGWEWI